MNAMSCPDFAKEEPVLILMGLFSAIVRKDIIMTEQYTSVLVSYYKQTFAESFLCGHNEMVCMK